MTKRHLHMNQMSRGQLIDTALQHLPRRFERRAMWGRVRVLGCYGIERNRGVLLRFMDRLDGTRRLTYVLLREYRQPAGLGYRYSCDVHPSIIWTTRQPDVFPADCETALNRLAETHAKRHRLSGSKPVGSGTKSIDPKRSGGPAPVSVRPEDSRNNGRGLDEKRRHSAGGRRKRPRLS